MTILGVVIVALWVLILVQSILNVAFAPRLDPTAQPSSQPLVSVVIPARNEAASIERTVRAFLAQDYPAIEVIVVDDRSTDGTGDILRGIDDPRLTVLTGSETPAGWLGKPWALDQGSRASRGDLILAVDADIYYAPAAVRAAVAELLASDAAMLSLLPHFEMKGFGENLAIPMMGFLVFAMAPSWIANKTRTRFLGGGAGSGNLIRRPALERLGFFSCLQDEVIDDVGLAWRLRRSGERTVSFLADDLISLRMYRGLGEVIEGFTKNGFSIVRRSYVMLVVALALMYVVHIHPYVLALTGSIAGIVAVILISTVRVIVFRSLRYRIDSAVFLHLPMILVWAYIFLRSAWITGIRKQVRWRGRVFHTAR